LPGTVVPRVSVEVSLSGTQWELQVRVGGKVPLKIGEASGVLAVPEKAA